MGITVIVKIVKLKKKRDIYMYFKESKSKNTT